ncbi:hypothetical protein [Lysinibacillus odysseyi]|uniref:DUF4303 domain-containing protein n=1 Tax=Lysinibacillus odysseyi 34hs-1 = NBRC 100172 TaxID=1220589 RepID=A0A0A3JJL8_9BACI|nr:hypothetical protein [Lysinibacillus odysseyi]KGR87192.1 hypothetical protein CD32_03965 [Lysinibacillus odysseyi 34hs-1 = NBRC 100172]
MRNEIQELFGDYNLFARQIANVQLSNLSFDVYEFRDGAAMQVDLLFTEKDQFDNIQEAFSAIFKKQLFDGEEWDMDDEPDSLDEQWMTGLENFWINAYFPTKNMCIELVKDDFISKFKRDLADVNVPEPVVKELLIRLNHIETIQILKGYVYDCIFGQSDSHYFLFEWGIYD